MYKKNAWHLKNAMSKFEALEAAYDKCCGGLLVALHIADDDPVLSKNVNDRQETIKQEFEPVKRTS